MTLTAPEREAVRARARRLGPYATLADACEAGAEALAAMRGWQPIETAPKDGTDILLYPSLWDRPCDMGRWNDDIYAKRPSPYWDRPFPASRGACRAATPTHWMSLPQPPEDV